MGSSDSIFRIFTPLPPIEEAALWGATRQGDTNARATLIETYLPFARIIAARSFGKRIDHELNFDEYFQLGTVGLIEAIDRYDPSLGACFATFAGYRINGAILNGLEQSSEKRQQISMRQRIQAERLEGGTPLPDSSSKDLFHELAQVAIGLALGFVLDDPVGHVHDLPVQPENAYDATELKQLRNKVRSLIERLPEREKTVIKYHYLQQNMFADIAREMNLSPGRISQLHRSAINRLREMATAIDACDIVW